MIHAVFSSLDTFKAVTFHRGLNILLADKALEASRLHTRNSAGKSSLIEIIHFVLGAKIEKGSLFQDPAIWGADFGLDLTLGGQRLQVTRNTKEAGKIKVVGATASLPIGPSPDRKTGLTFYSLVDWKRLLGQVMFGIQEDVAGQDEEKGRPSFRALLPYCARRVRDGGFLEVTSCSKNQKSGNRQVCLSFLMGLDWSIPQALDRVREGTKQVQVLQQASKPTGVLNDMFGQSEDTLRELAIAEERERQLSTQLADFQVIPEFRQLRAEADRHARRLSEINGRLVSLATELSEYEDAMHMEEAQAPDTTLLQRLYQEVAVIWPEAVARRFEEVSAFHESVIRNRRSYLEQEWLALKDEKRRLEEEEQQVSARKREIMQILQSGGALEQHQRILEERNRVQGRLEYLRYRHQTVEQVARLKTELSIEKGQLNLRLSRDFEENQDAIKRAIALFETYASTLYERPGTFSIHRTDNGPDFVAKIPGGGSAKGGISHMEIFCFDLMLATLLHKDGRGPGFLIHDSHLFDGVDARQVGSALALGAKVAEELGIQYIVTLNSDVLPGKDDMPEGADLEPSILGVRLKDTEETGGLFGFRFG